MSLFDQPCVNLNCRQSIPANTAFCPYCGTPQASGRRVCGRCGTENKADARYCKGCGAELALSAVPPIQGNRWARQPGDFAVRIEANDLNGIFQKTLVVEPGTNVLLTESGQMIGTLAPGAYTLETLSGALADWLSGGAHHATALLVDVTPTDLDFHLGGLFTQDPLRVGASVRVQVMVEQPGLFLINFMGGQERISTDALRQYLYPQVSELATRWVGQHTIQELAEDLTLHEDLELNLRMVLEKTCGQIGLKFLQVRAMEMNLEVLDKIRGVKSDYAVQISEQEAHADGKQRLLDVMNRLDLIQLAEETQRSQVETARIALEAETQEKRAALYDRLRQAALSKKMNEVRSEADFEKFLSEIDGEKLLRAKERDDLVRGWNEQAQDHDRERAYLVAKAEAERNFELAQFKLRSQSQLSGEQLESEIDLARRRADFEFEQRRRTVMEELSLAAERDRIEQQRQENANNLARLRRQQELEDRTAAAKAGLEILAVMKANHRLDEEERLRIQREHELERARGLQALEIERWETQERMRQNEREHEIRRIREMADLSTEVLISLAPAEQAAVLADLKRTEILKDLSPDQILARAAENSPEVARAFQEKFRAIADGQASQKEKELYERLLAYKETSIQAAREDADRRVKDLSDAQARQQQSTEKIVDKLADTISNVSNNRGGQPVVIVPSGGPQVIQPGMTFSGSQLGGNLKFCTSCGHSLPSETAFCPYCGKKFEGMGS